MVDVVYTPWQNLHKRSNMEIGQIGFHDQNQVVKVRGVTRERDIIKRIEKTKTEAYPDLRAQRQARDDEVRANQKARQREARKQQRIVEEQKRKEAEECSYDRLFSKVTADADLPKATADDSAAIEVEEDFM